MSCARCKIREIPGNSPVRTRPGPGNFPNFPEFCEIRRFPGRIFAILRSSHWSGANFPIFSKKSGFSQGLVAGGTKSEKIRKNWGFTGGDPGKTRPELGIPGKSPFWTSPGGGISGNSRRIPEFRAPRDFPPGEIWCARGKFPEIRVRTGPGENSPRCSQISKCGGGGGQIFRTRARTFRKIGRLEMWLRSVHKKMRNTIPE